MREIKSESVEQSELESAILSSTVDSLEAENAKLREIRNDYATAARSIALNLSDFCNDSLTYPEMIADAARKAAKENATLRQQNAELVEVLEKIKRESGTHTIAVGQKTGFALIYDIAKAALANHADHKE